MTIQGIILGALIGIGTGAALLTSSPDNPVIAITTGVVLTISCGFVFLSI